MHTTKFYFRISFFIGILTFLVLLLLFVYFIVIVWCKKKNRTVAAALNSLSAVTTEDILITALNIKIDANKGACYGKWMSLGYGLISFALVFVVEQLGGILQATLTLNGLIGGVTLGLFSLGIFFKSANKKVK